MNLAGLGPKQSRNLWQWLGLTRYEIPLDIRVTRWVNENLTTKIDAKRLWQLKYYESVLDNLEAICEEAELLPCELDAAAFDYEDLRLGSREFWQATDPGFVNSNGQITIRTMSCPQRITTNMCISSRVQSVVTSMAQTAAIFTIANARPARMVRALASDSPRTQSRRRAVQHFSMRHAARSAIAQPQFADTARNTVSTEVQSLGVCLIEIVDQATKRADQKPKHTAGCQ
jgi:hypothetical protein